MSGSIPLQQGLRPITPISHNAAFPMSGSIPLQQGLRPIVNEFSYVVGSVREYSITTRIKTQTPLRCLWDFRSSQGVFHYNKD